MVVVLSRGFGLDELCWKGRGFQRECDIALTEVSHVAAARQRPDIWSSLWGGFGPV
jgi:hypothetical protein